MIYSKKGNDNKVHLYKTGVGTEIPANDDVQLTYKDNAGSELTIDNYKFFYDDGKTFNQIKASEQTYTTPNDVKVNVYAGNELIIGKVDYVTVGFTGNLVSHATIAIDDTVLTSSVKDADVAIGADAEITITPDDGYVFSGAHKITINGTTSDFTIAAGIATFTIEDVSEDISFSISATVEPEGN